MQKYYYDSESHLLHLMYFEAFKIKYNLAFKLNKKISVSLGKRKKYSCPSKGSCKAIPLHLSIIRPVFNFLRAPGTARRSNQSILREINPKYSLERLMLKLKLQYVGYLMQSQLIRKNPDAGED